MRTTRVFAAIMIMAIVWLCTARTCDGVSIVSYGAVSGVDTDDVARRNSEAIQLAFAAANKAPLGSRTVVIPEGDFYVFNSTMSGLKGVTLMLEGTLVANNNISAWAPVQGYGVGVLSFENCMDLTIDGGGTIDGQGYIWWWDVILGGIDKRPVLVHTEIVEGLRIQNVVARNSPAYHFSLHNIKDAVIENVVVDVDVEQQKELLGRHDLLDANGVPIFPLNTDGIDIAGVDVVVRNVSIRNYDDTVCLKPSNSASHFGPCTQNVTVQDSRVEFGVGMSVGSVPPSTDVNCIRNSTFERIHFSTPFKAIYVKSNPGDQGTGIIEDIVYRDLYAQGTLWYPIWIGMQQQHQPGGGADTGCSFFFPEDPVCVSNPRVRINNIQIFNFTSSDAALMPGVFLANATTPTTLVLEDVFSSGPFAWQPTYYCDNVIVKQSNVVPRVTCPSTVDSTVHA